MPMKIIFIYDEDAQDFFYYVVEGDEEPMLVMPRRESEDEDTIH